MVNPLDLSNRVVVVTGASSGIGLAVAMLLGRLGAKVVLMARDPGRLAKAMDEMEGTGHRAETADVSDLDALPEVVKRISLETGPLSGVVHCAGAQITRPLRMMKGSEMEELMRINVSSALTVAKGFRQKGVHTETSSIVFMSSIMGLVGAAGNTLYCATKGALGAMTKALALELAPEGIRVNAIAPGYVKTPMLEKLELSIGQDGLKAIEQLHPLGLGQAADVANAAAFLLADTGRWITGTTLVVDGGYTAR